MSMRMKFGSAGRGVMAALLLSLAALASQRALGQELLDASRIYAGFGLAGAELRDRYQGVAYGDGSLGWQIYGGYRIRDRVAVELGYKSFGSLEARDVPGSGVQRLDISSELDVAVVRATMTLPLSELFAWRRDLSVFGSAGLHSSTLRRSSVELRSMRTDSDSVTDVGFAFGGGVLYRIGRIDLRGYLEWLDVNKIDRARDMGVAVQIGFARGH